MWNLHWFRAGEQQVIETTTSIVASPKAIALKNDAEAINNTGSAKATSQKEAAIATNNSETVKAETQ